MQRLPVMLYHGNQDAVMIPVFGQGKSNNDYGQGFYTTPDKELGKEWHIPDLQRANVDICIVITWKNIFPMQTVL